MKLPSLLFLTYGDTNYILVAETTDPSQTTQDGKLARFQGWLRGFIRRTKELWHNSREP